MPVKRFIGFGEMLLRLAPDGVLRFAQAERFNLNYTGAEGNMAIALSYMGVPSVMVTKFPENDIGRAAGRKLMMYGVNTDHIAWGGERLGVYYLERGASQRPSKIIYDRRHSSIAEASSGDFDWDAVFAPGGHFHFTGITPALSASAAALCLDACRAAKRHGVTISCDLNYRSTLWSEEAARTAMVPLMQYVDLLFANAEHADIMLGVRVPGIRPGALLSEQNYIDLARAISGHFPGIRQVAFTERESISASVNNWAGYLYSEGSLYHSRRYRMQIVDRIGGGDAFAAGLIYGLLNELGPQRSLEYATAASCLKHSIEFDFALVSPEEVFALIEGDGSGRVQR